MSKINASQLGSIEHREAVKGFVDGYFRNVRNVIARECGDQETMLELDLVFQKLLGLTHRRSKTSIYKRLLKSIKKSLVDLEKEVLLLASGKADNDDPIDSKIVMTLKGLVPSAALSYEQAIVDLREGSRSSWRGPAADLRETLREVLDHLAPDKEVIKQPEFTLEKDAKGPTMKQKVRYVLRKRGLSKSCSDVVERSTSYVDDIVGGFIRSVYTRSSVSAHTPTERTEVVRIKEWVRTALCELLEL